MAHSTCFSIKESDGQYRVVSDREVVEAAKSLLLKSIKSTAVELGSPHHLRDYLRLEFKGLEHEVFHGLFLDSQNRLIANERLFTGTLDGASVYPREVIKAVMKHNAASVIFAHNHPSSVAEPSQADHRITERLQQALALIDVRVLDHFVVGNPEVVSFAENGWL
ncbi:MAG: DNA repair protein RadC [Pseudomonadota bacterium]